MNKRTPISKIMTPNPYSVNVTQGLRDVNKVLLDHSIHHLPVVSGDQVIGIISKNDIERISYVNHVGQQNNVDTAIFDMLSIEQVMTKDVQTMEETDLIKEAAEVLATGKFHAMPITKDGKLTGIVTSTDLINFLLEQF